MFAVQTDEAKRLRYYIQLYQAMMARLTPEQAWLVTSRYVDRQSLKQMLTGQPTGISIRSKTTLSKRCSNALNVLDCLIERTNVGIVER